MEENFNKLTPAQTERLALLSEELGEAIQAIGKILRHGYASVNPTIENSLTNKQQLELEIGDIYYAVQLLTLSNDIGWEGIDDRFEVKSNKHNYLHHQELK